MTETKDRADARKHATARYGCLVHAGVYAAVMVLLVAIDLVTSPQTIWFIWPMLGWGIAVALHFAGVYLLADRDTVIEALTDREMQRRARGGADRRPQ